MSDSPLDLDSFDLGEFDTPYQFQTIEEVLTSTAASTIQPPPSHSKPALKRASSTTSTSSFATAASSPSSSGAPSLSSTPTVIDRSISSQYVKTLTELLQSQKYSKLQLRSRFEYWGKTEFSAACTIYEQATGETVFEMPTTGTVWPNKKRAKEEAAKLAVDWVELEENLGARVAKAREIEKREKEEREKAIKAGKAAPGEDGINWVGQLVEWGQLRNLTAIYTTYALPPQPPQPENGTPSFSCTVELSLTVLQRYLPTLTEAPILGSATLPLSSKKAAKTAAAKAAIDWIVSKGLKTSSTDKRASEPGVKTSLPHPLAGKVINIPRNAKARKMVAEIAKELNYAVEYEVKPVEGGTQSMYTASAIVKRRWGRERDVKARGSPEGMFGRENAKEKVAQKVVAWFVVSELKRLGVGHAMKDEE